MTGEPDLVNYDVLRVSLVEEKLVIAGVVRVVGALHQAQQVRHLFGRLAGPRAAVVTVDVGHVQSRAWSPCLAVLNVLGTGHLLFLSSRISWITCC